MNASSARSARAISAIPRLNALFVRYVSIETALDAFRICFARNGKYIFSALAPSVSFLWRTDAENSSTSAAVHTKIVLNRNNSQSINSWVSVVIGRISSVCWSYAVACTNGSAANTWAIPSSTNAWPMHADTTCILRSKLRSLTSSNVYDPSSWSRSPSASADASESEFDSEPELDSRSRLSCAAVRWPLYFWLQSSATDSSTVEVLILSIFDTKLSSFTLVITSLPARDSASYAIRVVSCDMHCFPNRYSSLVEISGWCVWSARITLRFIVAMLSSKCMRSFKNVTPILRDLIFSSSIILKNGSITLTAGSVGANANSPAPASASASASAINIGLNVSAKKLFILAWSLPQKTYMLAISLMPATCETLNTLTSRYKSHTSISRAIINVLFTIITVLYNLYNLIN